MAKMHTLKKVSNNAINALHQFVRVLVGFMSLDSLVMTDTRATKSPPFCSPLPQFL